MSRLISLFVLAALLFVGALPAQAAANYTGGSGHRPALASNSYGAISFMMKTTFVTSNPTPMVQCDAASGSKSGWVNYITGGGLLVVNAQNAAGTVSSVVGTHNVADGAWHRVVLNFSYTTSGENEIWLDGALEAHGAASAAWGGTAQPLQIARAGDGFWNSYSGGIAEVAAYSSRLTSDQIQALNVGFSPVRIGPMKLYMPLVRDVNDVAQSLAITTVGVPTIVEHPRVVGH